MKNTHNDSPVKLIETKQKLPRYDLFKNNNQTENILPVEPILWQST